MRGMRVVRLIGPVRRIPGGEIDLRGLLEAVDSTGLADVGKAIAESRMINFDPQASWP